jgi:hypothetical protein
MDSHDAFRDRVCTRISLRRGEFVTCLQAVQTSDDCEWQHGKRTATDHTKLHELYYTPNNVVTSTPANSLESGATKHASRIEQVTSTSEDSHDAFHSYKL